MDVKICSESPAKQKKREGGQHTPATTVADVVNLGPSCWKQPNQRKIPGTEVLDTRPHADLALSTKLSAATRTL